MTITRSHQAGAAGLSHALLVGDSLVLLAFTLGGMAFHSVPGTVGSQAARIAAPFFLGYFLVAYLLGALRVGGGGWEFTFRSAGAWLAGIGLGVLLRIALEGRLPVGSFVMVTFAFTGALLLGWRALYWLVSASALKTKKAPG